MTTSVGSEKVSELVLKAPPVRSQSESDATEKPKISEPQPGIPRVATYTFNHDKKLFHGITTKKKWKFAAQKTKSLRDPWGTLGIDSLPEEGVTRHMYNPRNGKWKTDQIVVKMQAESFARGAMRECYRMKKLSKFSQHPDWKNASNYVAKRYMKEVPRDTYFEDVKLQMDSKLWGEEYNKVGTVPKKVDFFQTYIIEFKGREGSPLYGVEHFIDGGYVKYNSNSGFVSDLNRLTPQTFSHFTFERSNHQLIIVDIQGVGDLYTDPQMHTVDQKDYGEANLGVRGMALFFSSHICSPLCKTLGMTQFDLSAKEMDTLLSKRWNFSSPSTKIVSSESTNSMEAKKKENNNLGPKETVEQAFRRLSENFGIEALLNQKKRPSIPHLVGGIPESPLPLDSPLDSPLLSGKLPSILVQEPQQDTPPLLRESSNEEHVIMNIPRRVRTSDSLCSVDSADEQEFNTCPVNNNLDTCPIDAGNEGKVLEEESSEKVFHSSSVDKEKTRLREEGATGSTETNALKILGLVHIDLAKLHEAGRFTTDESAIDNDTIKFHLDKAASCGNLVALFTLAHVYLQLPHEDFEGLSVKASLENEAIGMQYLLQAAEGELRPAMFEVAKALDTGYNSGGRTQDWSEAVTWYHKVLEAESDSPGDQTESMGIIDSDYLLMARLAEMYRSGGHDLDKDPEKAGNLYTEAAEAAMNAMKGKLSNKYYMLAEEAWGEMED